MSTGFKRIYKAPRRYWRAVLSGRYTKANYLYEQSRTRFERRDDAFTGDGGVLMSGEIGRYMGMRFIETPILRHAVMTTNSQPWFRQGDRW